MIYQDFFLFFLFLTLTASYYLSLNNELSRLKAFSIYILTNSYFSLYNYLNNDFNMTVFFITLLILTFISILRLLNYPILDELSKTSKIFDKKEKILRLISRLI